MFFETKSIRGSKSVDGVCHFESVPPDQLCPGIGLGSGLGLGLGAYGVGLWPRLDLPCSSRLNVPIKIETRLWVGISICQLCHGMHALWAII